MKSINQYLKFNRPPNYWDTIGDHDILVGDKIYQRDQQSYYRVLEINGEYVKTMYYSTYNSTGRLTTNYTLSQYRNCYWGPQDNEVNQQQT